MKGFLTIIGGILIHITLGTIYLWANINIYITSYFRLGNNPTLSVSSSSFIFPCWFVFQAFGMFYGVKVAKRIGFKVTALISMLGFASTIFLASFMKDFWIFMLIYGILPPSFLGFAYLLPIHCGWAYFPENRGKVTGSISFAFGIATSVFNNIATYLANPDNNRATIKVHEGS
jgi:MFS family permease